MASQITGWIKDDPPTLDASKKYFTNVPMEAILSYPDLSLIRHVDLSRNRLEYLPDSFAPAFIQLKILDISYNYICQLPLNIGALVNLVVLNCRDNLICRLPSSFGNLTQLFWLDLSENPFMLSLAEVNDTEPEDWSAEGCKKAAILVVDIVQQINEFRAQELRSGVLFGVESHPGEPNPFRRRIPLRQRHRDNATGVLPALNDTASTVPDEEDRPIFQVTGPFSQANGRELSEPEVKASVMETETWDDTINKKPSIWTIYFVFKILCLSIGGGLSLCLILVCLVEQTKIDQFLDKHFGFLPPVVLDSLSDFLYSMQIVVTMAIPALPLFKVKPVKFLTKCYNFAWNTYYACVDYFISPHNLRIA